jgi:hypothetical protein
MLKTQTQVRDLLISQQKQSERAIYNINDPAGGLFRAKREQIPGCGDER